MAATFTGGLDLQAVKKSAAKARYRINIDFAFKQ
jgi:hypothetical protein